ncbi:MAG: tetratricopeptide repeat protein, partial [Acetobacteraceae bacterium]
IDTDTNDIEATLILGLAVGAQGRAHEAAPLLDRVARARPGHAHPSRDLGDLLLRLDRAEEASVQYRVCLAHAPDDATAHHAMGLALAEMDRIADAIHHFRQAVHLDPRQAPGWSNLGMMLKIEQQFHAALVAHDNAVARAPTDPQIRVNRAVALLHTGRLAAAWADYEWRLKLPGHTPLPLDRLLPDIRTLDLTGRTILVTHEEGFGDTLHFLRYVPLLEARGAHVLIAVPNELRRLLANQANVLAPEAALPQFDFHCPFFSLPRAFGTTMETIPGAVPYLHPDPHLVAHWAHRLPPGRMRVGLVWAGQARPWLSGFTTLDRRRSAGLEVFAPLTAVPHVHFISLQKGQPALQARTLPPGLTLHDPMPEVADFADTAAIITNLDLVISVDTAVVHLAGAMGKPVFLLDRYDNCWRWFADRDDSPWYPTLRIFRQERMGEWEPPIRHAATALEQHFLNTVIATTANAVKSNLSPL